MSRRPRDLDTDDESSEDEGKRKEETKMEDTPAPFEGDIVNEVARKLLEDGAFTRSLDEWLDEKVANLDADELFLNGETGTEHRLEHTALHTEFTGLFEEKIEGFISSKGLTSVAFFNEIRESQESSAQQSSKALVGQIMLTTFDFDVFLALIRETKSRQEARGHK
jgi:hypothetical protein